MEGKFNKNKQEGKGVLVLPETKDMTRSKRRFWENNRKIIISD